MNKIKLIFITTLFALIISNANSAQKDCSVFKHALDKTICEKQNLEAAAKGDVSTTTSSDSSENKGSGFFNKITSKIKLKKHKKNREVGD